MIEREVKIAVPDHALLRSLLLAMGATEQGVEQEINRILDGPDGRLRAAKQVLRVRSADRTILTFKAATPDDGSGHKLREELEVAIGSGGDETLLRILARLGYSEVLRYDKRRESWRWRGVVIALDSLAFGHFVEIEGDSADIDVALRLLDLQDCPREGRSYPELQRQAQSGQA